MPFDPSKLVPADQFNPGRLVPADQIPTPDPVHHSTVLRGIADAIEGARTAGANLPGVAQVGQVTHALANSGVGKWLGQGLASGTQQLAHDIGSIPGVKEGLQALDPVVAKWIKENPDATRAVADIAGVVGDVASIYPVLRIGRQAVPIITAMAAAARAGKGREAVQAVGTAALRHIVQGARTAELKGAGLSGATDEATSGVKPTLAASRIEPVAPKITKRRGKITVQPAKVRIKVKASEVNLTGENKLVLSDKADPAIKAIFEPAAVAQDAEANLTRALQQARGAVRAGGPVTSARRYFSIPRWSFRDLGALGRQIIGMASRMDSENTRAGNRLVQLMRGLPKLTAEQGWMVEDVLQGKLPIEKAAPEVQQWVNLWKPILDKELPDNIKLAKLTMTGPEGKKIPFNSLDAYSTHSMDHQEIDRILSSKAPADRKKAEELLGRFQSQAGLDRQQAIQALTLRQARWGPAGSVSREFQHTRTLEMPRWARLNPTQALPRHYMQVYREINRVLHLGEENSKLAGVLRDIGKQYGQEVADWATHVTAMMRGDVIPRDTLATMRATDLAANITLPIYGNPGWMIKHLTQLSNTFRVTGVGRTIGAAKRFLFTPEGREAIKRLAPYVEKADLGSIYEQGETLGQFTRRATNVTTAGLPRVYRNLKILSSYAGRIFGEDALKVIQSGKALGHLTPAKAAELFQMAGIDTTKLGEMAANPQVMKEVLDQFGAFIGEDTFFGATSLSMSEFSQHPVGRAAMLLRQYVSREGAFLYDQMVRNKGEIGPNAEMLAIKLAGGFATTEAVNAAKSAWQTAVSNKWSFSDFVSNYQNTKGDPATRSLDAMINGFGSLPLLYLLDGLRYGGKSVQSFTQELAGSMIPAGVNTGVKAAAGAVVPFWKAAHGDIGISEVPGEVTRNELNLLPWQTGKKILEAFGLQ